MVKEWSEAKKVPAAAVILFRLLKLIFLLIEMYNYRSNSKKIDFIG